MPPLIYESALNMIKRREILARIGTLLLSQAITMLLVLALVSGFAMLTGLASLPGVSNTNMVVILGLVIQLNDYSGTLDPHISFSIEDSSILSFLSTIAVFKNACLIYILTNIMPSTKANSPSAVPQILYGLYQVAVPLGIALGIVISTTLVVKQ